MVELHPEVLRYLAKLAVEAPRDKDRCIEAIKHLEEDPYHRRPGVDISRWEGPEFGFRLRAGRHRFGYRVDRGTVGIDDAWFK